MCLERSKYLLKTNYMSMIVPMSIVSTQRMKPIQKLLEEKTLIWYANFAWRPGKLFDVVNRALTIFITHPAKDMARYSTGYLKWYSDSRNQLFDTLFFTKTISWDNYWVPKFQNTLEQGVTDKMMEAENKIHDILGSSINSSKIYYKTTGGLYWKVFTNFAPKFTINGEISESSRQACLHSKSASDSLALVAILSSNLFWWWYTISSTLRDLNPADILFFPILKELLIDKSIQNLGKIYIEDLKKHSNMLTRQQKSTGMTQVQSFKIQMSKPIIDEIDTILAKPYGFTDEELDFIINYDIKYRMGVADDENIEG